MSVKFCPCWMEDFYIRNVFLSAFVQGVLPGKFSDKDGFSNLQVAFLDNEYFYLCLMGGFVCSHKCANRFGTELGGGICVLLLSELTEYIESLAGCSLYLRIWGGKRIVWPSLGLDTLVGCSLRIEGKRFAYDIFNLSL